MSRRAAGFTLIEMAVVVAIVGILASGVAPLSRLLQQRAQERELRQALRDIRGALDRYHAAHEAGIVARQADGAGYPPSLEALTEGVPDTRSGDGRKLYFLRRLPRDPFFPDPRAPAVATWGLRASDSPPDEPRPGRDVFDVHSLSPASGLNGVPYRDW